MKSYKFLVSMMLLSTVLLMSLEAQNVVIDFEDETEWSTEDSVLWTITDENVSGGEKSMRYSVADDVVQSLDGHLSIETGHTIQKVRIAKGMEENYIVASSYDGIVMAIAYDGAILWKNNLSGFMVHDMWCADISGDGVDELVVANADGATYCLDAQGKLLWKYHPSEVPMYSVCVVEKDNTPYVVCGGFDLSIYYLSAAGEMVKEIKSSTYSVEKVWGIDSKYNYLHFANFIRPVPRPDGTQFLAVHGSSNHMQVKGTLYFFEPMADKPFKIKKVDAPDNIGDFRVSDMNGDGTFEILLGISCHQNSAGFVRYNLGAENTEDKMETYLTGGLGFGYVVTQPELIKDGESDKYMELVGNHIILVNTDLATGYERLQCSYSFNDMWKDGDKIVLASAQSGGSSIHILNTRNQGWKKAYREIEPMGKLKQIIDNHAEYRSKLASYERPPGEREPLPLYLMTESTDAGLAKQVADDIRANYNSPIFLGGSFTNKAEDWDRSGMENEKYRNRRDGRRDYSYTQQQCVDLFTPWYNGEPGIAFWGGHGNDPYMFQLETHVKTLDFAQGKKTVLIYPELEDHSEDFAWVMEDLFYPLADSCRTRNANIFVRTKHNFWQGNIYLPMWEKVMDGRYPDIFVPSMEETTDKTMDISVAGRSGVWASGAVSNWGTRSVPDNPSFDRSRQFSHPRIPSHFLRHMVYHIASGATYINNFAVNPDYMSFLWELIAKGVLYVPKTEEIVSYSPVHLGMTDPDEHYMVEGSSLKWSVYYDEEFEENNPFVFSRQNATWMAAKVTDWDFSTLASGVKDRRQNYLPPYPNGMVLITPPQEGVFAKTDVPRGTLKDHLHPLYSEIMTEFVTDGRHYYSADGTLTLAADEYASSVAQAIQEGAEKLPLTVTGDVAWVVAQTSPTNLRLTIIDGGYLNPDDRVATVTFNAVTPVSMRDVVDGKTFNISNPSSVSVDVPCGLFRFIDIELSEALSTVRPIPEVQPNVLIVHTDEHNFRTLGSYRDLMTEEQAFMWGPGVEVTTPNIDRLAEEGAVCTSYYASNPVCSPSRASLVSGLYPIATGTYKNDLPMKDEVVTFAEVLRQRGYATSYVGKWHLDGEAKPGFAPERKFGFQDNRYMMNRGHWKQAIEIDGQVEVKSGVDQSNPESFMTDFLVDKTIEIIKRDKDKPFCHMLSIPDPHGPNTVRLPYSTMFENLHFDDPRTMGIPEDERPLWAFGNNMADTLVQSSMQTYFGMVKCIDDNVGRILTVLEDEGVLDNTIVIFTSDHGDLMGEHNKHNKSSPYEASAKIPFLIRYPESIKAGKVINSAYTTVDFAPILLGIVGVEPMQGIHGKDASVDFLSNEMNVTDDRIVYMTSSAGNWSAAVNDRYKLVLSKLDDPWLFDLEEDPDELTNYYSDPAYSVVAQSFVTELVRQMTLYKDPALDNLTHGL